MRQRLFQERVAGLHTLKSYRKWDCQTLLTGIWAMGPWKRAQQDTCTQHKALVVPFPACCGMLDNLSASLLQAPQLQRDLDTCLTEGQTKTQKRRRKAHVLFGSYFMIFLRGCIYDWVQPGFVPAMSFKEKKSLQLFLKQHPSATFTGGQFSQVFEDETGKVSSFRSPAGI